MIVDRVPYLSRSYANIKTLSSIFIFCLYFINILENTSIFRLSYLVFNKCH